MWSNVNTTCQPEVNLKKVDQWPLRGQNASLRSQPSNYLLRLRARALSPNKPVTCVLIREAVCYETAGEIKFQPRDYGQSTPSTAILQSESSSRPSGQKYRVHHQGDNRPDDKRSTHLWNVGLLQRDYTALYARRLSSWYNTCTILAPTFQKWK
jgi:hypothetical protein